MTHALLYEHAGLRTFAVVFDAGDDPVAGLKQFAAEQSVDGAQITAIGAFQRVTVGYFDGQVKEYQRIQLDEQVEVLTLAGNLGLQDGKPALHAHLVVGRRDGTAHGGHLLEATVRPTLEVVVIETPRHFRRVFDRGSGVALIDLGPDSS